MQSTTALGVVALSFSLGARQALAMPRTVGRGAALLALSIGLAAVGQRLAGDSTALLPTAHPELAGATSAQSGVVLAALGVSALLRDAPRRAVRWTAHITGLFALTACFVFAMAYVFGASEIVGGDSLVRISVHSLACFAALAWSAVSGRARSGPIAIFTGTGLGSHFARRMLPAAVVCSTALVGVGEHAFDAGLVSLPVAAGLTAAALALVLSVVVVLLARRLNQLEAELRDASVRDELTALYNRRGFNLLAQQAMEAARRRGDRVSLLYFDVDGLKRVNDTLGHDVGSAMLVDFATLLAEHFRRDDIIGRLGGDEFAAVCRCDDEGCRVALRRLYAAAARLNAAPDRSYDVEFSVGEVLIPPDASITLDQALTQADAAMYRHKAARKSGSVAAVSQQVELAFG